MKKLLRILCLLLLLSGCSAGKGELQRAVDLRQALLSAESCSFLADITADYGDAVHKFSVSCQGDSQGNLNFTLTAPETIAGIRGHTSDTGGQLTFEDTALQFDLLTDRQLTPLSGPWIFLRTLRSGYLQNAGMEEDLLHVCATDTYEEDALQVDLYFGPGDLPVKAEILYRGRRILTLEIQDFCMD